MKTDLALAIEWGYKCCERGINLEQAFAQYEAITAMPRRAVVTIYGSHYVWHGRRYARTDAGHALLSSAIAEAGFTHTHFVDRRRLPQSEKTSKEFERSADSIVKETDI